MPPLTLSDRTPITLGTRIGSGGEGVIYDVRENDAIVAKIYHTHRLNQALANKVHAMVANPPEDVTRQAPLYHVSIAWPIDIIVSGRNFVGYMMPKVPKSDDLYALLQPQQRKTRHSTLDHRHLYRTARNLASAMTALHQKGYVIGDVNFKNARFNDAALVTLVDCDSMQVTEATGVVHRCMVGLPEYTPPELQGKDFATTIRTPHHDTFGLAVLIFQLLMQGFHPFAGRPTAHAPDVEQAHLYCLKNGIFPYRADQLFVPPQAAPSYFCLPGQLRTLFERAFTTVHNRPTPKEWEHAIRLVEQRLVPCATHAAHYHPHDGACVICAVESNSRQRSFTHSLPNQQPLSQPLIAPARTWAGVSHITPPSPKAFVLVCLCILVLVMFFPGSLAYQWMDVAGSASTATTESAPADAATIIENPTVTPTLNNTPNASLAVTYADGVRERYPNFTIQHGTTFSRQASDCDNRLGITTITDATGWYITQKNNTGNVIAYLDRAFDTQFIIICTRTSDTKADYADFDFDGQFLYFDLYDPTGRFTATVRIPPHQSIFIGW